MHVCIPVYAWCTTFTLRSHTRSHIHSCTNVDARTYVPAKFTYMHMQVGSEDDKGIVPRVAIALFDYVNKLKQEKDNVTFEIVTSMIEIYSEKIRDLLGKQVHHCVNACIPACFFVSMYVCILYIYIYVCMYIYIYVYIYVYI